MTVQQLKKAIGINGTVITLRLAIGVAALAATLGAGWNDIKADAREKHQDMKNDIRELRQDVKAQSFDRWTKADDQWYTDKLCDINGLIMPPHVGNGAKPGTD